MEKSHIVFLGLGSNLGDRTSNLLEALQWLRQELSIERVSSCYETEPVGYLDQPRFLNLVCSGTTHLSPRELFQFVKSIEKKMGRQPTIRNGPRPIDIDILLYDDLVLDEPDLIIPHPRLAERAFVLVPLAEIAPEQVHPVLKETSRELLRRVDKSGVSPAPISFNPRLEHDVQEEKPRVSVSLSRVGITNVERIIRIMNGGHDNLFWATMEFFADLNPRQSGVHMSRFSDTLEEVVGEIVSEPSPDIESLAERLAQRILDTQRAIRSEAHIVIKYPMQKWTPVSAKSTQELYTLITFAVSTPRGTKRIVGVEAEGMTACPCAQDLVRSYSREKLLAEGFTPEAADKALDLIPIATHNQRGRGTLFIGADQKIPANDLVHIVESSMSSETYDLLKRPDELFVVNKAHRNPRFVEDVVREMLKKVVDDYGDLPDGTFVQAKQVNFEGIHKHDAFAERYGTLGEIRREVLHGEHITHHSTMLEWLDS